MTACCCFVGLSWCHHSSPVGLPHLAAELRRKIIRLGCFCQHSEPPLYILHPSAAVSHPPWLLLDVCHCFLADPVPSIPCSAARQHPARSCSSLLPGTFIIWEHPACELQLTRLGEGDMTPCLLSGTQLGMVVLDPSARSALSLCKHPAKHYF